MWESTCAGCFQPGPSLCRTCAGALRFRVLRRRPAFVSEAWAASGYEAGPGGAIVVAKGRPDRSVGLALARAFGRAACRDLDVLAILRTATWVTWVPSPWTRTLARGFSLPGMMAYALAPGTHASVRPLLRVKPGRRQAQGGRATRSVNLRGRIRSQSLLSGTVVLVDDVVTTGSTASASARELLGAGADRVILLTLCAAGDVFESPGSCPARPDGAIVTTSDQLLPPSSVHTS
jgi:predicted amidophosphoribosyltransferase